MVALRKDVKVGFVVGGVMLAVVGVYFALKAVTSGDAATNGAATASLQTSAPQDSAASDAAIGASSDRGSGASNSGISNPGTSAVADAAPARTSTPAVSTAAPQPTPGAPATGSDDVWAAAFSNGAIPPARTVTPERPTNTSREPAARPNEIIEALTTPSSDAADTRARTASASANDGTSGTIASSATSATLTRAAGESTSAGSKTHTVTTGETLSSIAAIEYGSANAYDAIVKANPSIDPNRLKVGTQLIIPAYDSARTTPTAPASVQNVDSSTQYVVKPGDSLHKIASTLYGSSSEWQAIYDANRQQIGESPANIKVGQTLTLPKPPTRR